MRARLERSREAHAIAAGPRAGTAWLALALVAGACEPAPAGEAWTQRSSALTCAPEDCDDGNPCTLSYCHPTAGCVIRPRSKVRCDDGDLCTLAGVCVVGVCTPGPPRLCSDGDACTTDGCDPAQGCTHAPIPCSDGNPCTDDICDSWLGCFFAPANGAPCEDGDACTQGDFCAAFQCFSGPPDPCDDGSACTGTACDPQAGCTFAPQAEAEPCDDGDACTAGTGCEGGACVGGEAVDCGSDDPCTVASCDPQVGCVTAPEADGAPCDDGDACTGPDTCQGGACQAGPPLACEDGDPCTANTCEPATGCAHEPLAPGAPCDDGDACTEGGTCEQGACEGAAPVACDDGDPCTTSGCDPALGCVFAPVSDGTPCPDGDVCNGDETCQAGACAAGAPLHCDDGEPCTEDGCDAIAGCQHALHPEGTPCDDDNPCTTAGACAGGSCAGMLAVDCDDGNPCTDDVCVDFEGCHHAPVAGALPCPDPDACSADSACQAGHCVGAPVACDDEDACTSDTCDPATGCTYAAVACDDGDPCTEDDCDPALGCLHPPVVCDDGDPCTVGACTGGVGELRLSDYAVPVDPTNHFYWRGYRFRVLAPVTITALFGGGTSSGMHLALYRASGDTPVELLAAAHSVVGRGTRAAITPVALQPGEDYVIAQGRQSGSPNHYRLGAIQGASAHPFVDVWNPSAPGGNLYWNDVGSTSFIVGRPPDDAQDTIRPDLGFEHTVQCTFEPVPGCCALDAECDTGDPCSLDTCVELSCAHEWLAAGTPCEDGDACTSAESCDGQGVCVAAATVACDDGDACTADGCDAEGGCVHTPLDCDDGNPCTDQACEPSVGCLYGSITCDPAGPCFDAYCDPAQGGCVQQPEEGPCDDGDPCTEGTACANGECAGGVPVVCPQDADPCTVDACTPMVGCEPQPVTCDDGDLCTADTCVSGEGCAHPPYVCDDGDPCTAGTCVGDLQTFRLGDYGGERAADNYWWRGYRFRVATPVHVTALLGGGTAAPGFHVALYRASGDIPVERLAEARDVEGRATRVPIPTVVLHPGQDYIIAQGRQSGEGLHHRLLDIQGAASHPLVAQWNPSGPSLNLLWNNEGDTDFIVMRTPAETNNDSRPEVGFEHHRQCAFEAIAGCCATSADCEGYGPCLAGDCVDGGCDLAPVAEGQPCEDGELCTTQTTCASGECAGATAFDCDDGDACTLDECVGDLDTFALGDFAPEEDAANNWWRGYRFRVAEPVRVTALLGGGTSGPGFHVALYRAQGNVPQALLAEANHVEGRRTRVTVPPVDLEPGQDYVIAQGRQTGDGSHYRLGPIVGAVEHRLIAEWNPSSAFGSMGWGNVGTTSWLVGRSPTVTDDDSRPDVGFEHHVQCTHTEVAGCCNLDAECDTFSPCHVDTCVAHGCVHEAFADGTPCDDGDACTDATTCQSGHCTAAGPLDCDDGDACTVDTCDSDSGCQHAPLSCDDGDACTSLTCDPASGCLWEPFVCDDGDPCTTDQCVGEVHPVTLASYASASGSNNHHWRGYRFRVSAPVQVSALFGGGTAGPGFYVALYRASGDTPVELLAEAQHVEGRRTRVPVPLTPLEPGQDYLIAQGRDTGSGEHFNLTSIGSVASHPLIAQFNPSSPSNSLNFALNGAASAPLGVSPSANNTTRPDVGVELALMCAHEPIAECCYDDSDCPQGDGCTLYTCEHHACAGIPLPDGEPCDGPTGPGTCLAGQCE